MILEFADRLNLVTCNTFFMKKESQLVTYAAGPVIVDYTCIIVRQEDKAKVRNVKVISKHKLLVMDMQSNTRKRWYNKFEPRVGVWKLKEEKREEYQSMVKDKVEEHTYTQPFYGSLDFVRDNPGDWYQKKHSPTR